MPLSGNEPAFPTSDDRGDRSEQLSFEAIVNFVDQMIWSTRASGHHDYFNRRWYEFTGVPHGSTDGEAWSAIFHPDDQQRARETWRNSLETGDAYQIEYRLRHHSGEYRWVLGRAQCARDAAGRIIRWYGSCTDINDTRKTMELNAMLSRELSHRIKNIFAVISSLISMSGRSHPESKAFADEIRARIAALGRAHEFVRPHSDDSRPTIEGTTLRGILLSLFAAYPAAGGNVIRIQGADVPVDDRGATPIALLFHELATNAVKYGALSRPDGTVDIHVQVRDDFINIDWVERGGPELVGPPNSTGFGTRLADISILNQLNGALTRDWRSAGLVVRISVPSDSLTRNFGSYTV